MRENAKAKQNESVEVVASETATESEESVEKTAEVSTPLVEPAKNFPDFFIIDPCLIQVYENRKLFGDYGKARIRTFRLRNLFEVEVGTNGQEKLEHDCIDVGTAGSRG